MSKKGKKKEENEVKSVNTDVTENDLENAYYNYEESSVSETKKPGFFKRLFRGKKKVTTSNELNKPQEEDFYQSVSYGAPDEEIKQVEQTPPPQQVPVNNYNNNQSFNNNQTFNNQNNFNNNQKNFNNNQNDFNNNQSSVDSLNYNYQAPVQQVEPDDKPLIPKKTGYFVAFCVLAAAIVIVIFNLMSSASEKYYIEISTSSMVLRPYEGAQISFLTNNTKKTSFKSSNDSVVTVTEYGYIKAAGYKQNNDGYLKATITVGNNNSKTTKQIDVYVVPTSVSIPMEDFTVESELSVKVNEKKMIEITNIVPPNNTKQRFDYIAKDTSIVDVDGVGVIQGRRRGTTTIEVRNHTNKNLSKIITVTVK